MIRAIVFSSLCLGARATDAPAEGFATCLCLGKNNLGLTKSDCTFEWQDADGKCVHTVPNTTNFKFYPGSYGETCQKHLEPGAGDCFNITASPPYEKIESEQATWCNDPWCYVDPCACDVKATQSSYFKSMLAYSYATCGASNNFIAQSELADQSTAVGDAICKADGSGWYAAKTASPTTAVPSETSSSYLLASLSSAVFMGCFLASL